MTRIHRLKTWPKAFQAIADGVKRYEIRKADRDFRVGDTLHLLEYDPVTKTHSGRSLLMRVTYMTPPGEWGLPDNICVMSLIEEPPARPAT